MLQGQGITLKSLLLPGVPHALQRVSLHPQWSNGYHRPHVSDREKLRSEQGNLLQSRQLLRATAVPLPHLLCEASIQKIKFFPRKGRRGEARLGTLHRWRRTPRALALGEEEIEHPFCHHLAKRCCPQINDSRELTF